MSRNELTFLVIHASLMGLLVGFGYGIVIGKNYQVGVDRGYITSLEVARETKGDGLAIR